MTDAFQMVSEMAPSVRTAAANIRDGVLPVAGAVAQHLKDHLAEHPTVVESGDVRNDWRFIAGMVAGVKLLADISKHAGDIEEQHQ